MQKGNEWLWKKLLPCKNCNCKPVLEFWSSGGVWCAVRCTNPDRPDDCDNGFDLSKSKIPEEAVKKWNKWVRGEAE